MNLKRLEYFCQLAELGNFTRAAQTVGIAQPALTVAIQKLEQEVGLKLINRADNSSARTLRYAPPLDLAIGVLSPSTITASLAFNFMLPPNSLYKAFLGIA